MYGKGKSSTSEPSVLIFTDSSSSVIFVSHNVEEWISASSGEIPAGEVTGDGENRVGDGEFSFLETRGGGAGEV